MRLVWHTNVISPKLLTKIAHFAKQFRPFCFQLYFIPFGIKKSVFTEKAPLHLETAVSFSLIQIAPLV